MKRLTQQEFRKYQINHKYQRSVTNQIYIYPRKIKEGLSYSSFSSINQPYNLHQQNKVKSKQKSKSRQSMTVQILNFIKQNRSNYQLSMCRNKFKELSFDQPQYSQCYMDQDTAAQDAKYYRPIKSRNATYDKTNQNKILEKMKKKTHKKQGNINTKKITQIQSKKIVPEKKQQGHKLPNKILEELLKKLGHKINVNNFNKSTKIIVNKKSKKIKNSQRIITQYC